MYCIWGPDWVDRRTEKNEARKSGEAAPLKSGEATPLKSGEALPFKSRNSPLFKISRRTPF